MFVIYICYRIFLFVDVVMIREYLIILFIFFFNKKICVRLFLEVLYVLWFVFLNCVRWVLIDEEILFCVISIEILF